MRTKKFRAFGIDAVTIILFTKAGGAFRHLPLERFQDTVIRERVNMDTGEISERVKYKFKIRNLYFTVSNNCVWVTGSLATYLHRNNVNPLRFVDIPKVLAKLKAETGFDFSESIIYAIELSSSISMKCDPNCYPHFYQSKGLYKKNYNDKTWYIQTDSQKKHKEGLRVYNKSDEANVPGNVLRNEWKIVGHVADPLGLPGPIFLKQLCDSRVWNQCVERWKQHSLQFIMKPLDRSERIPIEGLKSYRANAIRVCVSSCKTLMQLEEEMQSAMRDGSLKGTQRREVRKEHEGSLMRAYSPECAELRKAIRVTAMRALCAS